MEKQQTRRIRNLIFVFVITAFIVSVATYAWFIGMRTVNINEFQVKIAGAESLQLSVDGKTFADTVDINSDNFDTVYAGNTNTWGGDKGLIPLSSVGVINQTSSRLELYEKASITPSPGGYRLIASKIENTNPAEAEKTGYVAFDLFVRNFTGEDYIIEENAKTEEAIYLTVDSGVTVDNVGGVLGTGIENSVRVAFAQIGRVKGNIDLSIPENEKLVQDISCAGDTEKGVTGICSRGATIWEPNDDDHVIGAINWYNTACRTRTGSDVRDKTSFNLEKNCGLITNGLAYPTYAINSRVDHVDNVDIYDGKEYNAYEGTTKLEPFRTFTDTMKLQEGMNRDEFMTLAPNSITKIRVYVYIEGQDVDNFDFAQVGKAISIQFGFTKQRFTEADTNYGGPNTNEGYGPNGVDKNAPVITIEGFETSANKVINHTLGEPFVVPEGTATDNKDQDVTVVVTNKVNVDVAGKYTVVYKATDSEKNVGTRILTVIVG